MVVQSSIKQFHAEGFSESSHFASMPGDIGQSVSQIFEINAVHVFGPESGPLFLEQHGSNHSGWNWGACLFWVRIPASISGPTFTSELTIFSALENCGNAPHLCDYLRSVMCVQASE